MTLRVTLEIVPFGEEEKKYQIGQMNISNMGSMNEFGLYEYQVQEFPMEKPLQHMRADGAWALVRQAITVHHALLFDEMYPERSRLAKATRKRIMAAQQEEAARQQKIQAEARQPDSPISSWGGKWK